MHLSHSLSCRTEIPPSYLADIGVLPDGWVVRGHSDSVQYQQSQLLAWRQQAFRLWMELFVEITSLAQLAHWESRLPNAGCSCQSFYRQHIAANAPTDPVSFEWKYQLKSAVNAKIGKPNLTIDQARWMFRFTEPRGPVHHLITRDDLFRDTQHLARLIYSRHPDIAGVAGMARSGMAPAVDIALMLGVDLYECQTDGGGIRLINGGVRRTGKLHGDRRIDRGTIVIVDDSTCSGHACRQVQSLNLPFYVVYAGGEGKHIVDGYAIPLELPHFFSWNLLHNGIVFEGCKAAFDLDGVFAEDCPIECDDDGPRYLDWMRRVQPLNWSIEYQVPTIITARREVYRSQTMDWLNRNGIRVRELVMFPGTFDERSRTNIGQWKAEQAMARGCGLFVESDYKQAFEIARVYPTCQVVSMERPS